MALFDHAAGGHQVDVFGVVLTLPPEAKFSSVESVQRYVDRVLGTGQLRVRPRKGVAAAHYEMGSATIAVPVGRSAQWALRELVILHEIAHHVTWQRTTKSGTGTVELAAHGPEFVTTLIELAARVMGPEAGLTLRIVFAESGVATSIPTNGTS